MCEDGYDPCESYYNDYSDGVYAGRANAYDDMQKWIERAIKTAGYPQYRRAYQKVLEALDEGCV